jgi:hypothetical protein
MTNDDLFAAFAAVPCVKQVESVKTPVPMFVRAMGISEWDDFEILYYGKDGKAKDLSNWRAKYLFFTLADEQGNRLFTDQADIKRIAKLPYPILEAVFHEARAFNGHEKAEEKKSDSASEGVTGSDSPSAES